MNEKIIKLRPIEAYILWSVICWWGDTDKRNKTTKSPRITHTLKAKLFEAMSAKKRQEFQDKYDSWEIPRIVELGLWISEKHPEWVLDKFSPEVGK